MSNDNSPILSSNPEEIDAYELALDNADMNHMEDMEDNLTDVEADAMTLEGVYGPEDHGGDGDW